MVIFLFQVDSMYVRYMIKWVRKSKPKVKTTFVYSKSGLDLEGPYCSTCVQTDRNIFTIIANFLMIVNAPKHALRLDPKYTYVHHGEVCVRDQFLSTGYKTDIHPLWNKQLQWKTFPKTQIPHEQH